MFPNLEYAHLRKAFSFSNPKSVIISFALWFSPTPSLGVSLGKMAHKNTGKRLEGRKPGQIQRMV